VPLHSMIRGTAPRELLTIPETAVALRCSKAHVQNILNRRVPGVPPLPHIALGRRKLVMRSTLEDWIGRLANGGGDLAA
jgi:hypothetical protein